MKKLLRIAVVLPVLLVFGVLGILGWRHFARPFDARLVGTWTSNPQKTLAYWEANYEWAKDRRLVEVRSKGLGQMSLTITDREVRFKDHPCHGSPVIPYWITAKTENEVHIGLDGFVRFPHWGTFRFENDGMWSIVQMGNQEVREFFIKAK